MRRHRLRRRYGHTQALLPKNLRGTFESTASGREAFVTGVHGDDVFIRLGDGSNGNMPVSSFLRQYRRVRKAAR